MHCPNCGNEGVLDQKFCRTCGFNLEAVGKLISSRELAAEEKAQRYEREQAILRRMYRWMMWGCLVLLIGVVLLVTGKSVPLPKIINLLASFLLIGGTTAATYGVLAAMRDGVLGSKRLAKPDAPAGELAEAPTTKELAHEYIPAQLPSVTERTTDLIGDRPAPKSD